MSMYMDGTCTCPCDAHVHKYRVLYYVLCRWRCDVTPVRCILRSNEMAWGSPDAWGWAYRSAGRFSLLVACIQLYERQHTTGILIYFVIHNTYSCNRVYAYIAVSRARPRAIDSTTHGFADPVYRTCTVRTYKLS